MTTCANLTATVGKLSSLEYQQFFNKLTPSQREAVNAPCSLSTAQLAALVAELKLLYPPLKDLLALI